ncbi:hypothetical protein THAPSDRAFT_9375 [Thalassiosira pseudonana CCMP1335]|uniref:HSF-type DNA-binding domain-containing protein n=1 Tax=Thalassiosira pseudonana TaxID=35128 RepID=B8CB54_THAPS|nr:hypothetical protein THAPSDRAFT_9375 [Thalassiosira pseudonana CCMP1335]EED89258.1 hypothetical protein THAPSDRAFT_9375 [Thalassiosira pseudonana CCMP1335]
MNLNSTVSYQDRSSCTLRDHFASYTNLQFNDADIERLSSVVASHDKQITFPMKLHFLLNRAEDDGFDDIISWLPHGRSFVVKQPIDFIKTILPQYFRMTKMTSFTQQLSMYGFVRIGIGQGQGQGVACQEFFHEYFLRHRLFLCDKIIRSKLRGEHSGNLDFYSMPEVTVSEDSVAFNTKLENLVAANLSRWRAKTAARSNTMRSSESCASFSTVGTSSPEPSLASLSPVNSSTNKGTSTREAASDADGTLAVLSETSEIIASAESFLRRLQLENSPPRQHVALSAKTSDTKPDCARRSSLGSDDGNPPTFSADTFLW